MTTSGAQTYRFEWLDYTRGFAMLLVVVSHVRSGLIDSGILADPGQVIRITRMCSTCTIVCEPKAD